MVICEYFHANTLSCLCMGYNSENRACKHSIYAHSIVSYWAGCSGPLQFGQMMYEACTYPYTGFSLGVLFHGTPVPMVIILRDILSSLAIHGINILRTSASSFKEFLKLKIRTPRIITITVLKMEQFAYTKYRGPLL